MTGIRKRESLYTSTPETTQNRTSDGLRLGLLVPSSNTTMETEFWRTAPSDVTIHSARMRIEEATEEGLTAMDNDLDAAVSLLLTADVDVLCYGCTSGSFIQGRDHATGLRARLEARSGVPCVVTSEAVVEALRFAGVEKLVVATPYIESINEKERRFLEAHGFDVLDIRGLGLVKGLDIGLSPAQRTVRLVRDLVSDWPESDGVFISCTNLPTFALIERLESETGRPVVTSNQAALWMSCQKGGATGSFWSLKC